jgi:CHASE1-domain containing sensor protein
MAEDTNRRSNSLSVLAANLIVVVGVAGFVYVGEQMSQRSNTANAATEASTASR